MQQIIDFLSLLSVNNERGWFNQHKQMYLDCKARFDDLVDSVIEGIRTFDDSIGALTAKDCTYRIYRDTRFSQDKSPYKTHIGAFIAPEGKKSRYSGYYFQVGPQSIGYDAGCMIATGNYYCEPLVLKLLREDIALDEGRDFTERVVLAKAQGFSLDWDGALKRVPAGFDANAPYAEYLKLKNHCLVKEPGIRYMKSRDLAKRLVEDFRSTQPFLEFINRAIAFSRDPE